MTDQDAYVEKVIEENEERAHEHKHDGESKLEDESGLDKGRAQGDNSIWPGSFTPRRA